MKRSFISPVIFLLWLLVTLAHGQAPGSIGFHGGSYFFLTKVAENERIRGNLSYSTADEGNSHLSSVLASAFGGVSVDFFSKSMRLSYTTGLRYSRMTSRISANDLYLFNAPYFFYRFREDGLTTDYLTIRSITQDSDFLGIPVEARWFPFQTKRVRFFLKASGEVNVRMATKTTVRFFKPDMVVFSDEVADDQRKPANVNGIASLACGVRFGRPHKFVFGMEMLGPSVFFAEKAAGIVDATAGLGIMFTASIPLIKQI